MYKKFAELLGKTNKTAYQVSKDTGISQSVLSDWKTGRSNPKVDKLKTLADYFGVSIEYFLSEEKEAVWISIAQWMYINLDSQKKLFICGEGGGVRDGSHRCKRCCNVQRNGAEHH